MRMRHAIANNNKPSERIVVYTPEYLAKEIVDHFQPSGLCLEPCKGSGNILKYLPEGSEWCEIEEGRDFFDYTKHVDWIITNPPFKGVREWFKHSAELADNIVFLVLMYHIMDNNTIQYMREKGVGLKEVLFIKTPKNAGFPGFQLGVCHWKKGYIELTKITTIGETE